MDNLNCSFFSSFTNHSLECLVKKKLFETLPFFIYTVDKVNCVRCLSNIVIKLNINVLIRRHCMSITHGTYGKNTKAFFFAKSFKIQVRSRDKQKMLKFTTTICILLNLAVSFSGASSSGNFNLSSLNIPN